MKYLTFAFAVLAAPAFAQCPDPDLGGARYAATGPDLIAPQRWNVDVSGTHAAPCAAWLEQGIITGELDGYLPVAPTAVFELDQMGPHILMVMAETDEVSCTPVLAARTPDGLWYFGQTANGRQEVTIWGAPNGPLQVWIGSRSDTQCTGQVVLETFDR